MKAQQPQEWESWLDKWIYAHALLLLLSNGLLIRSGPTAVRLTIALSLSVVSFVLFWKVGLPLTKQDRGQTSAQRLRRAAGEAGGGLRGWRYLVPAAAIFGALVFVHNAFFNLLYVLYPCVFALSATTTQAVVASLGVSVVASIGMSYWDGWDVGDAAFTGTGSFVFALLFGLWITRIIDQSRSRGELISELTTARSELADVHRRVGVTEERERMAAEIHDTLAQGYASIVMLAQGARTNLNRSPGNPSRAEELLGVIESTARDNLSEARALVDAMRPAGLGTGTLRDALLRLATSHESITGVAVTVDVDPAVDPGAPHDVVLFRAAQEALTNVAKHSNATEAGMGLRVHDDQVMLTVTDNGIGLGEISDSNLGPGLSGHPSGLSGHPSGLSGHPSGLSGHPSGLSGHGLTAMRKRVSQLGGEVLIENVPSGGVVVSVALPFPSSRTTSLKRVSE
jgi:signal transduction histidine kinase